MNIMMKVLIACEESQEVCKAFRAKGHEAYSADIQEPSGGHLEWHILGDVLPIIDGDCKFTTMDGAEHEIVGEWDLLIAHPPCTHLAVSGARWFKEGKKPITLQDEAADFFMRFINAKCNKIAV
jgi:site-specific DNA-cytosine methylase